MTLKDACTDGALFFQNRTFSSVHHIILVMSHQFFTAAACTENVISGDLRYLYTLPSILLHLNYISTV